MQLASHSKQEGQIPDPFWDLTEATEPARDLLELFGKHPRNLLQQLESENKQVYALTRDLFISIIYEEHNIAMKNLVYFGLTQMGWWNAYEIPEDNLPTSELTLSFVNILAYRGVVDATHEGVYEAVQLALKYRLLQYDILRTNYLSRLLEELGHYSPEGDRIIKLIYTVFYQTKWVTMLLQANEENDKDTTQWLLAHVNEMPERTRPQCFGDILRSGSSPR